MHINIKNWSKFQHYKDRRPTWIKLLIEIIDQFDSDGEPKKFHALPDSAKLTFILLVCLRANYNKHIPFPDDKWLKERLGIGNLNLQPLIDAGFICIDTDLVQDDTDLIQNRPKLLSPETETERETYKEEREKYSPNSDEFVLSDFLLKQILSRKPDFKKPNLQKWSEEVDKMIRLDKRNIDRIREVIAWCQQDDFWMNNILSTAKLRKQFDKLELRMAGKNGNSTKNRRDYDNQKSNIGTTIEV